MIDDTGINTSGFIKSKDFYTKTLSMTLKGSCHCKATQFGVSEASASVTTHIEQGFAEPHCSYTT